MYIAGINPAIFEINPVLYMNAPGGNNPGGNNPAGNNAGGLNNNARFNQTVHQLQAGNAVGYLFPVYNRLGSNQPHLAVLAAYLENARLNKKSALTEHILSGSGHAFLREYIRATDPVKYESVYGTGRNPISQKPAY